MSEIQTALDALLPHHVEVIDTCSIGGGCISEAYCVAFSSNQAAASEEKLFVKSNQASFIDNFECETEGLKQLRAPAAIGIPEPIAIGLAVGRSWMITQWIEVSPKSSSYYNKLGLQLARLHRETRGEAIGWERDNYIGATRQPNPSHSCWPDFFATQRIEFQLRLAINSGYRDSQLRGNCEQIVRRMGDLLTGREDETSLLHGDLWSGNCLSNHVGDPILIDPAVYRGCREAEFGMIKLFGGCPETFYDSYLNAWPMSDGWQRRVDIYQLYHVLNHLNLFGSGYLSQCKTLSAAILKQ